MKGLPPVSLLLAIFALLVSIAVLVNGERQRRRMAKLAAERTEREAADAADEEHERWQRSYLELQEAREDEDRRKLAAAIVDELERRGTPCRGNP